MKKKYIKLMLYFLLIVIQSCSNNKEKKVNNKSDTTISIHNENGFYYLGHLGKEQQSEGTLICWAVCVVNVAQGILGDRQLTTCDLIKKGGDDCHINSNNRVRVHRNYNSRRDTSQIENEALKIGVKLNKFDRKHFNNFEYMKKLFREENVPIIVKLRHPEQSHLIYISGYGTFDGCNFYYVFDPLPGPESFRTIKDFNSDLDRKFEKAWKPQPKKNYKKVLPIKKSSVTKRINDIKKQLDDAYDQYKADSLIGGFNLKNPLLFASVNKIPLWVFEEEIFDESEIFNYIKSCSDLPECAVGPSVIEIKKTIRERDKKIIAKRLLIGNHKYTIEQGKLEINIKSDENDDILYSLKLNETVLQEFTKYNQEKLGQQLKSLKQLKSWHTKIYDSI